MNLGNRTNRSPIHVGDVFGRLTVIAEIGMVGRMRHFLCRCTCGNTKETDTQKLRTGDAKSCGCMRRDYYKYLSCRVTHRQTNSPEYVAWTNIKSRCLKPNFPGFRDYGGRGITIHAEWAESFEKFLLHVGPRPSSGHSIGRINNDGNYEPGNVRWETRKEQSGNTRRSVKVVLDGVPMCLAHACRSLGINSKSVHYRKKEFGMTPADAIRSFISASDRHRIA